MELDWTRHARNRMRLYDVSLHEAESALAHPDNVTEGRWGGQQAWKRRTQGGWLRVTFKDEGRHRIVITVTPRRQGPGGSHAD